MNPEADTSLLPAAAWAGPHDASAEYLASEIIAEGLRRGAARIHFEPAAGHMRVRFRIAGALIEAQRLPRSVGDAIVQWLARGSDAGSGLALSLFETSDGPRAVLQLATPDTHSEALEALGMAPSLACALGNATSQRGGLMLAAGPHGSGRTTTLHALMRHLDDGERCLLSVEGREDRALDAAMGQDADVILAGTIADRRAASEAMHAAEAGHLVLAAIDECDAVSAILRLRDLRVEPFQLASNLRAVTAQRLVRRLCAACREPMQAPRSVSALLGFDPGAVVYAPVGCDACDGTGFTGLTGVFEAIHLDAALRRLINDGGDGAIIARHAFLNSRNLGSAARALVREGVTTAEEAMRISRG